MSYFVIGVEHLVFGIDHVLFVIGLFLFIRDPIALIKTITAFTLFSQYYFGIICVELVKLDQGPTEAIIALSIFFLARELVQEEHQRSRLTQGRPWVMAFIFRTAARPWLCQPLVDIDCLRTIFGYPLLLFNVGIGRGNSGNSR